MPKSSISEVIQNVLNQNAVPLVGRYKSVDGKLLRGGLWFSYITLRISCSSTRFTGVDFAELFGKVAKNLKSSKNKALIGIKRSSDAGSWKFLIAAFMFEVRFSFIH